MTQYRKVSHIDPAKYFDEFVRSLANPARIWDHAFRNDLSEAAQHILLALASVPDTLLLSDLRIAFDSFYQHRRKKIGFATSSRDFEHALKELDGNFVQTNLVGEDSVIEFHNPSINDYLDNYLAESPHDVADLVQSAAFFEQFKQLWSGQRETRFSGVEKDSDRFVEALSTQFLAPSCRVYRLGDGRGRIIGLRHDDLSFEERMLFAVEVEDCLATPAAHALMSRLVTTLSERIEAGEAQKEGLVDLLTVFDRRTKASKSLFTAAKQFLAQRLDEFEDFSSVGRFVEKFPGAIDSVELDRIRQEFRRFSKSYTDGLERDPNVLRGIAEEITTVGKQLEVDVSEWADPLFQEADEIESERPSDPEPDDSDRGWLDDSKALRDVDLMFQGLLHEIDEKAP